MSVYLTDADLTLHHGDAAAVLADLPEGSVDCVVTSPPYFGLRDYGTASWEGGDPACDHVAGKMRGDTERETPGGRGGSFRGGDRFYSGTCGKCGAVRHDVQIGLEPTPEEYVAALVGVFREVWRVLAPWGTCWVNIGDSYAGGRAGRKDMESLPRPRGGHRTDPGYFIDNPVPPGFKAKDLLMMPARLALALQADGWWIRQENIWSKPNPMPESVRDRTTSAHEKVYQLTRIGAGYYYDAEAVREPHESAMSAWRLKNGRTEHKGPKNDALVQSGERHDPLSGEWAAANPAGRNLRNVWSIATEPTPEAHFATFPTELVRRCLAAGCPERVCRECGEPSRRIVEREGETARDRLDANGGAASLAAHTNGQGINHAGGHVHTRSVATAGWTDCGHDAWRPGIVLDPFMGSGTTALVARRLGLHAVGIDASAEYLAIAAKRLQQLSLLGGAA